MIYRKRSKKDEKFGLKPYVLMEPYIFMRAGILPQTPHLKHCFQIIRNDNDSLIFYIFHLPKNKDLRDRLSHTKLIKIELSFNLEDANINSNYLPSNVAIDVANRLIKEFIPSIKTRYMLERVTENDPRKQLVILELGRMWQRNHNWLLVINEYYFEATGKILRDHAFLT